MTATALLVPRVTSLFHRCPQEPGQNRRLRAHGVVEQASQSRGYAGDRPAPTVDASSPIPASSPWLWNSGDRGPTAATPLTSGNRELSPIHSTYHHHSSFDQHILEKVSNQ